MPEGTDGRRAARSPREVFAQNLTRLWKYAGNPTLQSIAAAANRIIQSTRGPAAKPLTVQRISDWRSGGNLPARFDSVRPVLFALIEMIRKGAREAPPELLNLNHWRQLWVEAVSWTPGSQCPYRGLEAYRADDTELFFGRSRVTEELVERVREIADGGGGIIAVLGASGAGKSSILAAGLIPNLATGWTVDVYTPGATPTASLPEIPSATEEPDAAGPSRRTLIIDQFEELFTTCESEPERRAFVEELDRRAQAGITVVLAVRADFFARCLEYPALTAALSQRSFVLGPMDENELTEAITEPARAAGLKLENGLAELIITELVGLNSDGPDGSGTLPLLSHVMEATWDRRDGARLTVASYRAAGGVTGSVAKTAQDAWNSLGRAEQQAAKHMLLSMVTVGQDSRDTRRQVPPAELIARASDPDAAVTALETLSRARLIILDADTATLTHEIVLDAWPELRKWIDDDRDGHLVRQRAESDAAEWVSADHSRALLYRGTRLARAEEQRPTLAREAREFLSAAVRARRQRIQVQAGLAITLVVLLVAALAGYISSTVAEQKRAAGFFATVMSEADRLQNTDPTLSAQLDLLAYRLQPGNRDAESRLLVSQNLPLATTFIDHNGGIIGGAYLDNGLLAIGGNDHAIRLWDPRTPGTVVPVGSAITDHTDALSNIVANGTLLISGSADHTVRIRDVSAPARPRLRHAIDAGGPVGKVAVSSDGRTLAAVHDGGITFWDISDPDTPKPLDSRIPIDGKVTGLYFGNHDQALITVSERVIGVFAGEDTVVRWNIGPDRKAEHSKELARSSGTMLVTMDPVEPLIIIGDSKSQGSSTGSVDSTIQFVRLDADNAAPIAPAFPVAPGFHLQGLQMSPDGLMLATMTQYSTTLWNLADLTHPTVLGTALGGNSVACPAVPDNRDCSPISTGLRFSPDGRQLSAFLAGGSIQQWALSRALLAGQAGQQLPLAISADGSRMLTFAAGADAHIWDIHDPAAVKLVGTITKPDYQTTAIPIPTFPSISYDGRFAALIIDNVMSLVDISDPGKPVVVHRFQDAIGAGFARDRSAVAAVYASMPPFLSVWDYSDPVTPVKLGSLAIPYSAKLFGTGLAVTSSSDGRVLAGLTDQLTVFEIPPQGVPTTFGSVELDAVGDLHGIAVSPDHQSAVTGWKNATVQVWNISDPHQIFPLGDPVSVNDNAVASVAIDRTGRTLAVGGMDSTVRLLDFSDPAHPRARGQSITPPSSTQWEVAFHPKADYLFAGGDDGILRVLDLDIGHAAQRICALGESTIATRLTAHLPDHELPSLCG
ncbi:hypothetical protein AB0N05_26630 [Nocardia sp. NPDC051030]|uniref:nSTAND1 domain-containing NTPase n=1 Tax=Nocardia sp. NPDC051030 TaxID=3155162 RepID=UPI0034397E72